MNPFITIEELNGKINEVVLICCFSLSNNPDEYYKGSLGLIVDDISSKFINAPKEILINYVTNN